MTPFSNYITDMLFLFPYAAHPTRDLSEVRDRFGESSPLTCEYKYDGERAQIHCLEDGSVRIFSRNCEVKY